MPRLWTRKAVRAEGEGRREGVPQTTSERDWWEGWMEDAEGGG